MKKNIIVKGIAAATLVATLGSCSGDYLDLEPITSIDTTTVTSTVEGAQLGMYGVCRTMWWPESAFGVGQRFIQGEAAVGTFYGEVFSPDTFYNVWAPYGAEFMNWQYMRDPGTWIPAIGWKYYYNLIAMSNRILDDIDDAEGDAAGRDFIKAQLLTIRAHSYTRLMQLYAPRWENSNGGNAYCIVLRTNFSTQDTPLVTMNVVREQIYKDLDLALALYASSNGKRQYAWEPDATVAYGVYARAAATVHDWAKCRDMAKAARTGFPIMTAEQYQGGFAEANGEWMWYNAPDEEGVYYWCWATIYGCNGAYTDFWGQGAGAISYDIIRQLDPKDIRGQMYLTPFALSGPGLPKTADWWNRSKINTESSNLNEKNAQFKLAISAFSETRVPGGNTSKWCEPNGVYTPDKSADLDSPFIIPFGAQYKFWGLGTYSVSSFPFMRAAEFALLEAEAAYRLNDETTARNALNDINSKRVTGYSCTATGDDLWKEIMLTSRIELWGEGHSWYNLKRWNIEVERKVWKEKDTSSNNFPEKYENTFPTEMHKGWTYIVPNSETRYNHAINMGLLN